MPRSFLVALLLLSVICFSPTESRAQSGQTYLSDLNWTHAANGYGPVERDRSNGESAGGDGRTITLGGATYGKGLGVHSDSELRFTLGGNYSSFAAAVGVDDEVGGNGSVVFEVWADGAKLFDSGVMTGDSPTRSVDVSVAGRQELSLVVRYAGDNGNYDHADWADARLTSVAGNQLPAPWATQDVGAVGQAGGASFANGTFSVGGSGANIYGNADSFRFVYQPLNGDGQIVARVANVQPTHPNAKAGVMIRENLNDNARFALINVTPGAGLEFIRRLAPGAETPWSGGGGGSGWVKLVRQGNTITGYQSGDGANWTQVGSDTLGVGGSALVGLAVTAHNNSAVCAASFDNVAVSTISAPTISAADASRFLEQSTFGATEEMIARVRRDGFESYLNEQFAAPISGYQDFPYYPPTSPPDCTYDGAAPTGPASICNRDNYSLFQMQLRFFQNAMNGQDQLRQRVALALGQVLVVSGAEINQPMAMSPYQMILHRNAFGNFRQLLYEVTLSPTMGRYLDMVNNNRTNLTTGVEPNENYARELLQLFSIGTYKLNQDGTPQLDGAGRPIPAYDEDTINGFASVFTGWTYPTQPGATLVRNNPQYYVGPMVAFPGNHDTGAKLLLDGVTLPANQPADRDLNDALDNVFNHPNVGPFISTRLIQHLVTSNPSPGYVGRVSAVFNNNGAGVRGDLRAVVRAILLDQEARGDSRVEPDYGKLREPVLFVLKFMRALGGRSDGVYLRSQVSTMGQNVLYPPSVFNYYPPDYIAPGTNIYGPEFAIQTQTAAINRANFVNAIVYANNGIAADPNVSGATGTLLDLAPLQPLAADPGQLLDRLNVLMMRGTMSAAMRAKIAAAVTVVPGTDARGRVRAAVYLVATSAQYQVER